MDGEHNEECTYCGDTYGLKYCTACDHEAGCDNCSKSCEICLLDGFCEDCIELCTYCNQTFCEECHQKCTNCGVNFCNKCKNTCQYCKSIHCEYCECLCQTAAKLIQSRFRGWIFRKKTYHMYFRRNNVLKNKKKSLKDNMKKYC